MQPSVTEQPSAIQKVEVFQLVPQFGVNAVTHNEILPLCISAALEGAVRICIMLVVISEKMNAIWFGHRGLKPVTSIFDHLRGVTEIIEVITEEDNFIGSDCGDNLFGPFPFEMDVGYNECNFHHTIIPQSHRMSIPITELMKISEGPPQVIIDPESPLAVLSSAQKYSPSTLGRDFEAMLLITLCIPNGRSRNVSDTVGSVVRIMTLKEKGQEVASVVMQVGANV